MEWLETSCSMCMSEVEGEEQAKVKIYLMGTAYINFQRQKQLTVRKSWELSILVCKHIFFLFMDGLGHSDSQKDPRARVNPSQAYLPPQPCTTLSF